MQSQQIWIDANGVAFIADTNTKVIEVVLDATAQGGNAEEIQAQHSYLSLPQIQAALEYYQEHKQELDADIERRFQFTETMREQSTQQFTRAELEQRLQTRIQSADSTREELLAGVTPENRHGEVDWRKPMGKEVW